MKIRQLLYNRKDELIDHEFIDSSKALFPHAVTSILECHGVRAVQVHYNDGSSVITTTERA